MIDKLKKLLSESTGCQLDGDRYCYEIYGSDYEKLCSGCKAQFLLDSISIIEKCINMSEVPKDDKIFDKTHSG